MKIWKKRILSVALSLSMLFPTLGCRSSKNGSPQATVCELDDGTLVVTEFYDGFKTNIIAYSNDEVRDYLEVKHPTFEQTKQVIENKSNIPKDLKKLLLQFCENFEREELKADLCVFYYNLQDIKFEFLKDEEMNELNIYANGKVTNAYFDVTSRTIYLSENFDLNSEFDRNVLFHEMVHTIDSATIELKDKTVYRINYLCVAENDKMVGLGAALYEGASEFTNFMISGNDHVPVEWHGFVDRSINAYYEYVDVFDLFLECSKSDVGDFRENGPLELIDDMTDEGIHNPIELMKSLDDDLFGMPTNCKRQQIYMSVFEDMSERWANEGNDEKAIHDLAENCIDDRFIGNQIGNGDENIEMFYGDCQRIIKSMVYDMIDGTNPIEDQIDYEIDVQAYISDENLFIYETTSGDIKFCYKIVLEDGIILYYDNDIRQFVAEEVMVCGDNLMVLVEKGIVTYEMKEGYKEVRVSMEKWQKHFHDSFQKTYK